MTDRPLLIFISDIHLTSHVLPTAVSRADLFERFWTRIDAARGEQPAHLVFVGDLFDLVRSPRWFAGPHRPYHLPTAEVCEVVEAIVGDIVRAEAGFFAALRRRVQAGHLQITVLLGNHDRLLAFSPAARRRTWQALTGRDEAVVFANEMAFAGHGVLAYHGNRADFVCHTPDDGANLGDAIGSELIVRFPLELRRQLGVELPELDEIDDVRPIFAVPSWVRHFGERQLGVGVTSASAAHASATISKVWRQLVEQFVDGPFLDEWVQLQSAHGPNGAGGEASKLRLLLQLSTSRLMRKTSDQRLVQLYVHLQQFFDGRFARHGAESLQLPANKGLRHVVNGHSHYASMVALGNLDGKPATYFNTGSWRTVHQMGRLIGGRPAFLKYEAMSYLVFFPPDDPLRRQFEWWTGALAPR